MNHAESKNPILEGSDILFECGQCGKSLAIDCRGAGLNIRCPQCDSELEVPIPEGFDLAELDKAISESVASDEEIKVSMPGVNAAVTEAIDDIAALKLKTELGSVRTQRQDIPRQNADMLKAIKTVKKQIDELSKVLDDLVVMLDVQAGQEADGIHTDETQKIG